MNIRLQSWHWVLVLIALAVVARILPHPPNITPVGALALFSGAYLSRYIYWLVPMLALLVSDWLLGWYDGLMMAFVYLGFAASIWVGRSLLWQKARWRRIAVGVGAGALVFWCISNFGVWLAFYAPTWQGFLDCYLQAIPFLGLSMLGDAIYALLLFSGYQLLLNRWSVSSPVMSQAST